MDQLRAAFAAGTASVWNLAAYSPRHDDPATTAGRLQAGIDAAPEGAIVQFPPGVFNVDRPIRFRPGRAYRGSGSAFGQGSVLRQADGANIAGGVLVPSGWWDNEVFSGAPVWISNLAVDGNRGNNPGSTAAGIVVMNYFTRLDHCYIRNAPGDGILLTDVNRAGQLISNSASENRIDGCRIFDAGRHGIHQQVEGEIAHLDGFLTDVTVDGTGGDAVRMDRAAGWTVRRAHVYNVQQNGLSLDRCHGTVVTGCQVEQFGREAEPDVFYAGISMSCLGVWASHLTDCFVSCEELSDSVGAYAYYALSARSGEHASLIATGNAARGPDNPTDRGRGIVLEGDIDGSTLTVRWAGNTVEGVAVPTVVTGGARTAAADRHGVEHLDIGGEVANRFAGADIDGGPVSGSGGDMGGRLSWGTGPSPAAGDMAGVAYETGYGSAPVVQITPTSDAAAGLGLSVVSHDWGFVVRASSAPAGDQAAGTFEVAYTVH